MGFHSMIPCTNRFSGPRERGFVFSFFLVFPLLSFFFLFSFFFFLFLVYIYF
ncbi:hypothetical protein M430DRAFT_230149 [Amorphotheca resinae ATCC 22711]|uniref:Uncharacterized protein n=1 Tax=Amorphotheca resinae ATCC 22711 TaxID=857342 RepID=A0A2T3B3G8_AMORE|nr:hypothetical protein M430DRAFT_230149 [Amorphotheca resinae ATCC 22711]PSS20169.1 hypothetical protein M430DRAFT_230149 [Amorphotheca resinae ATCC 22711]